MIFSEWNPDGGYNYYRSKQRQGIGDDLPEVQMPAEKGGIGVAAQDVGRRLPSDAVPVGHGPTPKGLIIPMSRSTVKGISGTSGTNSLSTYAIILAGSFGLFLCYAASKK